MEAAPILLKILFIKLLKIMNLYSLTFTEISANLQKVHQYIIYTLQIILSIGN